ncbi:hypothetical protein ABI59_21765 [Acidobacteria bacterium Mor1]|nr:hypothetical protein ABI59_21765 [Acidobacteria bacterium Mor1]
MAEHPSWTLPSNSGRERATWSVTDENEDAGERIYTCRVLLEGSFYGETLSSGEAGPAQDFGLVIHGLQVRHTVLNRLLSHLQEWLELPPAQLRSRELELSCGVGGLFDQALRLRFGPREDILSGGHPVATLEYVVGRMKGELSFAVALSGLQTMTAELNQVLAAR